MGPEAASLLAAMWQLSFDEDDGNSWDESAFRSLLTTPGVASLVCSQARSSEPKAFVLFRVTADEAEIITIATLPAARQTGLATHLLEALFQLLKRKDIRTIFLEVARDNEVARALYRKSGFRKVGLRKNYYPRRAKNRGDGLVLRRDI